MLLCFTVVCLRYRDMLVKDKTFQGRGLAFSLEDGVRDLVYRK